jgi:Protein of unknown function (DUF2846)
MKYILALILLVNSLGILAQDSLATVYFYRGGKFAGSFVGYDLKHNNQVIGKVTSNTVVKYRCSAGMQKFIATTESQNSILIEVKTGETYYVECSVATGVVVGRPSFRQVSSLQAQKEIQQIDPSLVSQLTLTQIETPQELDTVRALSNLFERKRKGGTARAVVFGVLGVASLVGTLSYKESTVTINQGSSGTQVIPVSSGPPVGNYVFVGFCAIMTFSGISQTNNFSAENLELVVNDYKAGKPLPQKVKRFLKKKDFK